MFRRKNQYTMSEDTKRAIIKIIKEALSHVAAYGENNTACMQDNVAEAKKAYYDQKEKLLLSQKIMTHTVDLWPEGSDLAIRYQEIISLFIKMLENDYECGNYMRSTNSIGPNFYTRHKEFYIRRHQIAEIVDNKILKFQEILISATGLGIDEILQESGSNK